MCMSQDWIDILSPLFSEYRTRKHPLNYKNRYQLVVMVVIAAQDSDAKINKLTPDFFAMFPSPETLAGADPEEVANAIRKVRGSRKKGRWLVEIANSVGTEGGIPRSLDELIELPGIGRKSANAIIRESGDTAGGITVDLHTARVATRIGITSETKADRIERKLMESFPQDLWNDVGISFSFLGRETCRPTNPDCPDCMVRSACAFYAEEEGAES